MVQPVHPQVGPGAGVASATRALRWRTLQFAQQARSFHDAVYRAWQSAPPGPLKDGLGRYTNFTEQIIENLRENIAGELGFAIPGP